ncbi:MAG: hypothetical protein WDM92_15920 [Caulobacteraceae bacterium]
MAALDQAILFERAHRYDEAETAYKAPAVGEDRRGDRGARLWRVPGAARPPRRGDHPSTTSPWPTSRATPACWPPAPRAVAKREPPAVPTIREGAAQALMAPAAAVLADKQTEMGLVLPAPDPAPRTRRGRTPG